MNRREIKQVKKMSMREYEITVLEETAVPLANGPGQNYFFAVLAGVIAVTVALLLLTYGLWYKGHQNRIRQLGLELAECEGTEAIPYQVGLMSPKRLLRLEQELEMKIAKHFMTEDETGKINT